MNELQKQLQWQQAELKSMKEAYSGQRNGGWNQRANGARGDGNLRRNRSRQGSQGRSQAGWGDNWNGDKGAGNDKDNAKQGAWGASSRATTDKPDWPCNRACCKRPENKLNFGDRMSCNWCNFEKSAAMSPPKEEKRGYVAPEEPTDVPMDKDATPDEPSAEANKIWSTDESNMLRIMGVTRIKAPDESKDIFPKPTALDAKMTADQEVAAACKTSDQLAEAQAQVGYYTTQITHLEGHLKTNLDDATKAGHRATCVFFRKALADEEKKIVDLEKKQSGGGEAALHDLKAKRNQAEKKEALRVSKAVTLSDEALARFERLKAVLKAQQQKILDRITLLETGYAAASSACVVQGTECAKRHVDRLAAWDKRISAAEVANGGSATPPVAETPAHDPGQITVEQSLAAANSKAKAAEEALALATVAAQTAAKEAQEANVRMAGLPPSQPANCSKKIRYGREDLVPYQVADANDRNAVAQLQANVTAWVAHALIPIQFAEILTGMVDKDMGLKGLQGFVGERIWDKFFPSYQVKLTDYVPAQFASILNASFVKLDKETKQLVTTMAGEASVAFTQLDNKDTEDFQQRRGAYQPW